MSDTLISLKNVCVHIGAKVALHDVNLAIKSGEIVTVVGPNGSGKSTLLRTLVSAIKPTGGQITRMPNLRIGYVPQKLHIDPTLPLTVRRFLSLPRRVNDAVAEKALNDAGAGDLGKRQMTGLSGGQFQRVLLARALLNNPHILILDEATQGLDQPGSADFYAQIAQVRQNFGCAVLMVSHELHVVMAASDRVICLNGHICCEGAPEIVASAPEYRALFGSGTQGALALYRHEHSHTHDETCAHDHAQSHHNENSHDNSEATL
ncbi:MULTISPECIES: ATP-binding cassette domain-containing protein [Pacificibacter]|uniref:ATP-binding cassette domain-containing protein n=1 Tax=Pacificibacter TaxID=1042323 RepID=UPI001C091E10|nr:MULTISPECIES: metal ABC transporter ATP-binding protein [Pacificibacter]MBU2934720.1 metal ABC transporter ATP-binding protein [Pacificibacter marinus]MDO6616838.1 metal ABC transporter ATP-binding protein [Pacificibacter sp. 1_MG-2023]